MSAEILRLLTLIADRGEPLPSNRELAEAVGYADPSAVTKAIHRLACAGELREERMGDRRCITITRTGRATLSAAATREGRKHENRRAAHSGMTPSELAVMELWDHADMGTTAIAKRLGRPRKTVDRIVTTYDGRGDHAEFRREAAGASARLLAAIARHFPERIAA